MSSLSLSSPAVPSLAFVPSPIRSTALMWQQAAQVSSKRQPFFFSTPPLKSSFADDTYESAAEDYSETSSSSITSNSDNDSDGDASNIKPPTTSPNMGASIGSQNVGQMLFNEELLKSGRGDVRVGHIGRWKDFRGNEIVSDNTMVDGPN